MKLLCCCVALSVCAAARAGTDSLLTHSITSQPEWYADNEWNVSLFGTYVFADNERRSDFDLFFDLERTRDTFLRADHAWGGGISATYFFRRYFGVGVEGNLFTASRIFVDLEGLAFRDVVKESDSRLIGSVLGKLTLRYPIGTSRFAPFACAGGGLITGGGERDIFHFQSPKPNTLLATTTHEGGKTKAMAVIGGGIEMRVTPHVGIVTEFDWSIVNGADNNFGAVRTGLNVAF
jgi:opacity protein-like surface antigen